GFLVAWQDYGDSGTQSFSSSVRAARVSASGVLDAQGVVLSAGAGAESSPALAVLGRDGLVVWQDSPYNSGTTLADIYGAALDAVSNAVTSADIPLSRAVNAELSPAVACCGTNFLAVWADTRNAFSFGRDIYGLRLDSNGAPLDLTPFPVC